MTYSVFHSSNEPKLKEILEGCLANRQDAQKQLFKLYYGYAKSICMRYCPDKKHAEEVLNSGFLKIFQNLSSFNPENSFRAWIKVIMIHTAIDSLRKEQKYKDTIPLNETYDAPFDDDILDKISAEEILEQVRQLPASYRTVFVLYVIEGYNHREIGELLGISEGTSKSNLSIARAKLKTKLLNINPNVRFMYNVSD
ncbi:MAG: sigma-70 family RNA polymerase sigma factor [Bacteroidia bacterium]|nr:sigma-70 family RNA polymerase sigma factor [Bacteroidia bacterium]